MKSYKSSFVFFKVKNVANKNLNAQQQQEFVHN